jgi:outer membrane protein assembly factor BamB
MKHVALSFSALLFVAAAPLAEGEDDGWPQWRGPRRNGLSKETEWSPKGKAESLWESEVGLGYSSVTIAAGRLYTTGHDPEAGLDVVWCLDAESGEEIWAHAYPSKIWDQFHTGGTLTTPTIDGDVVYILNREGTFFCLDAESGDVHYERKLGEEMDIQFPTWGLSGSPLILGDDLYVNVGPIVSLEKKTGKTRWTSKDYGHAYSTPAAFEWEGKSLLAVFNGNGLAVIERKGGKELSLYPWKTKHDVNASTPIVIDDAIFISSGYNHGGALLALTDEGLEPIWETRDMKTQMSGSVLIDGHLYGFDDKVLKCFGLDGEEKWAERGLGNGALMGAPGRLIVISGKGDLIIAKASPAGYEELSKAEIIDDGGVFWTTPVLVNGLIYGRSSKGTLVCRDHRVER